MFTRIAVSLAVVLGISGLPLPQAQAQIKIFLPPISKAPVYTPVGSSAIPSSSVSTPTTATPLAIPSIVSTATLKVTGPKAKFEPENGQVYHGASLPETWSENGLGRQIKQYNEAAGKRISVVTWFASTYENGTVTSWRQNYSYSLERVKRLGALSLIKFSTQDYAWDSTHKMFDLKDIAGGTWDDYFIEAAHTVGDFKLPVFISIDHEMNGNWYPYSQTYPGSKTTAADYVAAWKRIVSIFRKEGANNAAFVWSPNVPDIGGIPYTDYYPGDDYVDWVGISFYSGNSMSAMDTIYRQLAPRKPFFITEWATSTEQDRLNSLFPGDVEWVKQFFTAIETRYPRVKAISWFNWQNAQGDHRLTRVAGQSQAYAQDIAASRYLSSPGDQIARSNATETPRLDVVPNEIVKREKPVAPPPPVIVPKVVLPSIEKIMAERINNDTTRINR
ncbi:endoglucanase H [Abditibacteriota bacterium]|nr:endoglucanase H [Abditibacteriota bacterium]